jgi:hypothetical protein
MGTYFIYVDIHRASEPTRYFMEYQEGGGFFHARIIRRGSTEVQRMEPGFAVPSRQNHGGVTLPDPSEISRIQNFRITPSPARN